MTYHVPGFDRSALRAYRLGRVQQELQRRDIAAALLYDPINVRYATDCPNMQVWTLHNRIRYAFVPAAGLVTLFEFAGAEHLAAGIETIAEVRPAQSATYLISGSDLDADTLAWAAEIRALLTAAGGGNRRLALDVADPHMVDALRAEGIDVVGGTGPMEHARWIKNDVELVAMQEAIDVCETGMARMHAALRAGITENALWSILQQTNIELGGEWIETRLLTSGPKTKPWFQECGHRVIDDGDLVSFDTDLIGPNGYCADISRSWLCGGRPASDDQRFIYSVAHEQVHANIELMRAGMSFREIAERAYRVPERCRGTYYSMIAHGVGMCDEAPIVRHPWDVRDTARDDGRLEAGMVLSVEALVAIDDGREAVKLEQMVAVTDGAPRVLSGYPFEAALMRGGC